jgi:hypothetical protein
MTAFLRSCSGKKMVRSSFTRREKHKRRDATFVVPLCLLDLLVSILFSTSGHARALSQAQQKESLGSLSSVGEVYVNDSPAPGESTIFTGDRLRTGEAGTATFTVSGKGTLKILPRSEVVFSGLYQFTAELKNGTAVLNSIGGPTGLTLRVENFVLVPSFREQSATTRVESGANGSFLISCLAGSVGVLTLDAKSGQFLQTGQSLSISTGRLISSASPATNPTARVVHSGWLYLGLGGAAAAATAAGLSHGGGKQSISPSQP